MRTATVLMLIGLAGCGTTSETVFLQNAAGQNVQCGPYTAYGNIPKANESTQQQLRDCIGDYQRQGYERVPGPSN